MSYIKKLFSGRIGALAYFIGNLISLAGFWLIRESSNIIPQNNFLDVIEIIVVLLLLVFSFSIVTRRLHDLNKSAWLNLLVFIPLASLILEVILLFKPGSHDTNKYGPPARGFKYILRDLFALK